MPLELVLKSNVSYWRSVIVLWLVNLLFKNGFWIAFGLASMICIEDFV